MRALACVVILAFAVPAAAQTSGRTADRLYVMDCGHNAASDQARWSPGVNVGKPIELSDSCTLIKQDRKSTRLNSSHIPLSRMPSSA